MAATLSIALTSDNGQPMVWKDPLFFKVIGKVALTGSYVAGGVTFDLTTLFALAGSGPGKSIPSSALPAYIRFWSGQTAVAAQTGLYVYNFAPGTTLANGKLQLFTGAAAQSALTEFTAGVFPAGVLADVIYFEVAFPVP
jgi:hypothetical protein